MILTYWKRKFLQNPLLLIVQTAVSALAIAGLTIYSSVPASLRLYAAKEASSYGANIIITSRFRALKEMDALKIKDIFWRHNVEGISPVVESEGNLISGNLIIKLPLVFLWFSKRGINKLGEEWEVNINSVIKITPCLKSIMACFFLTF